MGRLSAELLWLFRLARLVTLDLRMGVCRRTRLHLTREQAFFLLKALSLNEVMGFPEIALFSDNNFESLLNKAVAATNIFFDETHLDSILFEL